MSYITNGRRRVHVDNGTHENVAVRFPVAPFLQSMSTHSLKRVSCTKGRQGSETYASHFVMGERLSGDLFLPSGDPANDQ